MTRQLDQGMTGIEKRVCHTHRFQEEGPGKPHREVPGSTGSRGNQGENGDKRLYCGFHGEKQVGQSRQATAGYFK